MEGLVHLVMGDQEELCYILDSPGEMFGWSALVELYRYRASACCIAFTNLIEIHRNVVDRIAIDYPEDGITIFRNLAGIVTEKLRDAYRDKILDADLEGVVSATDEGLQRVG
jgi:hypothetical protein